MGAMMRGRLGFSVACLACFQLLQGCGFKNAEFALRGKSELIGLRERDILMCAGHPTNEDTIPGGKIWMYEHGEASGGMMIQPVVPLAGAQVSDPNSGYCRVQFRFTGGKVAEVSYAGATDIWGRKDAICGPIVRNCLDYRGQQ
jgi:hypothetical protein